MSISKTFLCNKKITNQWQADTFLIRLVVLLVLCLFLSVFARFSLANPIQSNEQIGIKQCFADINTAYAHVIAQEQSRYDAVYRPIVNINRADEAVLTTLDGVGASKAQAIILYREMFGGFANIDELAKVKGIGQKTVDKNRDRLSVAD